VSSTSIFPGAVGTAALAAVSVTSGELAPGAVTAGKLALNSVGSQEIADGSIQSSDLAPRRSPRTTSPSTRSARPR
jgi:hypothetical protein